MVVFFFKQKTAYEIYQCDWSSDVCSSDLKRVGEVDMPRTHNATFSLSEPFDVGIDNGTPVSTLYPDHNPYRGGTLNKVTFQLLD